jgi:hypothetical protein
MNTRASESRTRRARPPPSLHGARRHDRIHSQWGIKFRMSAFECRFRWQGRGISAAALRVASMADLAAQCVSCRLILRARRRQCGRRSAMPWHAPSSGSRDHGAEPVCLAGLISPSRRSLLMRRLSSSRRSFTSAHGGWPASTAQRSHLRGDRDECECKDRKADTRGSDALPVPSLPSVP